MCYIAVDLCIYKLYFFTFRFHYHAVLLSQLLRGDRQKACRNLLKDYYTSLCKHLLTDCKELRSIEKQNRRILQVWPGFSFSFSSIVRHQFLGQHVSK